MAVIVRETLIGEPVEYRFAQVHYWQPACGCILATVTDARIVIHPRNGGRIWRVPRPLTGPIECVCRHGTEHRLSEDQAWMIAAGRMN